MYLTVAEGKNVSLVCRVNSDPESEIAWFFNGRRVGDSREDHIVVREQKVGLCPVTTLFLPAAQAQVNAYSYDRFYMQHKHRSMPSK